MLINSYPDHWKRALDVRINELLHQFPEAHLYVLIEGVFDESCYPLLKRSAKLPYAVLYASISGADEESLGLSPLLVEYAAAGQKTWDALIKKTDGHPALSLIVSTESLEQLASRLTPWCVIDAAGYTLALAFADTRILPQLFKVLTPEQIALICGPALVWQYVKRDGEWASLPLPLPGVEQGLADKVSFSEQQYNELMNASEPDNILFKLRTVWPALLQDLAPAEAHASAAYWLECADHAKIDDLSERMSLCEFGLQNPRLRHSPSLTSWKSMPAQAQSADALFQSWTSSSAA